VAAVAAVVSSVMAVVASLVVAAEMRLPRAAPVPRPLKLYSPIYT
jgi:hypothetical protein